MNPADVLLLAGLVLGFGLLSKRLEATVLTPPMVFVLLGLLVGPTVLGALHFDFEEGALDILAELTLVLVLFGDATRIDLAALRKELGLPARLLGIGLPLSIALGAVLAKVFLPELGWWEAAALGAVLAPTDAALGQAVVSSPQVPLRIRQALNVESGLNDGIALPFVLIFVSLASTGQGEMRTLQDWIQFGVFQLTLGPLVGFIVVWIGGWLVRRASDAGLMAVSFKRLSGLVLALMCFGGAELVGGNGFIAAFVGGMTLGNMHRHQCEWMLTFLETEGQLLMLAVFLGFGAMFATPSLSAASPAVLVYALVSLTIVRMIPVALSLLGSGLRWPSYVFVGWFGPRGLASILYGILILSEASVPHGERLFDAVVVTAFFSVFLHGWTAVPGAAMYGRLMQRSDRRSAEMTLVTQHPTRRSTAG